MNTKIINTPKPPYFAVIFSSLRTNVDDGYYETNEQLMQLAQSEHPDFLGIESFRDPDGHGVSIVYFRTYEAIMKWRNEPNHVIAKIKGRKEWYHHCMVRVAKVEHDYGNAYPERKNSSDETISRNESLAEITIPLSFETERLIIKPYQSEHSEELFRLVHINRLNLIGHFPITLKNCNDLAKTAHYINAREEAARQYKSFTYGLFLKTTNQLIGHVVLRDIDWDIPKCELAYWIDKSQQRTGLALEALQEIINHFGFERYTARVLPDNVASISLLEKWYSSSVVSKKSRQAATAYF